MLAVLAAAFLVLTVAAGTALAQGEPLAESPYADSVLVDLPDGSYLVDLSMEGGSGRAAITSPAAMEVRDGRTCATITWSSPHYDYMVVAGKRYLPTNAEGNSTFDIPIVSFDEPFGVIGDTTAMSEPHEVAYQLTFASASVRKADVGIPLGLLLGGLACIVAGAVILVMRYRAGRRTRIEEPPIT